MDTGVTPHIVLFAGIGEEVGLGAGLDAGIEERETVLGHDGAVVVARDNLQLAFQVACLADKAALLVAFGVLLRGVHIALAVHHLVVFPVDDGAAGHADLEHVGVVGHQRDGHIATIRPAVDAEAVGIDVGQRLQVADTLHLVLHLHLSQLPEGGLLEVAATVLGASVVEDEDDVALLGHIGLP